MPLTKEDLKAAKTAYLVKAADDPLLAVPLADQLHALQDEVTYLCGLLDHKAAHNRIHWAYATVRKQHLRAALATIRALHQAFEVDQGGPVKQHVDDGSEIEL